MPETPTVVAHDADYDGHGAAYAAWEQFGEAAEYVSHGDHSSPPEVEEGASLVLLDYSYRPEKLQWLLDRHPTLTIVDHHKTNAEAFLESEFARPGASLSGKGRLDREESPITYHYSENQSAATAAWEFFQGPNKRIPPLLQHIEDYDLWRFDREGTDALTVALDQMGLSLGVVREYAWDAQALIDKGRPMVEYRDGLLRRMAERADVSTQDVPGQGRPVTTAVLNATVCRSKLAEWILEENGEVEVVLMYHVEPDGGAHGSLRSDGSVDVSETATWFGGGGHHMSAGFPTTMEELAEHFG